MRWRRWRRAQPPQTVPNLVIEVGTDGKVDLFNALGSTHVVTDVVGWYGLSE